MMMVYLKIRLKAETQSDESTTHSKRIKACLRLRRNLCGPAYDRKIRGCCFGCHKNEQEAREDFESDITTVFLDHRLAVPAYNKWIKVS